MPAVGGRRPARPLGANPRARAASAHPPPQEASQPHAVGGVPLHSADGDGKARPCTAATGAGEKQSASCACGGVPAALAGGPSASP